MKKPHPIPGARRFWQSRPLVGLAGGWCLIAMAGLGAYLGAGLFH